jgi:hypothetical protein
MIAPKLTELTQAQYQKTLLRKLVDPIDRIRDLQTKLGLRAYAVRLVRLRWTGGKRGAGTATVALVRSILPVPKIMNVDTLEQVLDPGGINEQGQVILAEVGGRYTEDDLFGRDATGADPGPDEEFFYEVEFLETGAKRRFRLTSAPFYRPDEMQWWNIRLSLQQGPRDRAGDVHGP